MLMNNLKPCITEPMRIISNLFLNENGNMITDPKLLANKFNNFFINVAENLSKKNKKTNTEYQDYLKNPNKSFLFLTEPTTHEIYQIIQKCGSKIKVEIYLVYQQNLLAGPSVTEILTLI